MKQTWKNAVRPLLDLGTHLGVTLSDGSIALVDYQDRAVVEGWNWSADITPYGTVYARRGGDEKVRLHAAILGPWADHIDGNTLDCRRANLRLATVAQNAHNRRLGRANTSGFKGVSFRRDRGTWLACIRKDDKLTKIGTYRDPILAAVAYDEAAERLFGEFAHLNFGGLV